MSLELAAAHGMTYVSKGSGALLVLVHGSMNDHRYWEPQVDTFAAAHFETIALSLRHFWPTPWNGKDGRFSIDQHIEDVAAFINGMNRGPVHLLGHSRGAYIAFRVAERYPRAVRTVTLADPAGVLDQSLLQPGAAPANYAAYIADAVERVRLGDVEGGLSSFYTYAIGDGAWDRLSPFQQQICRDNALSLIGQLTEGRQPYSRASAQAIVAPSLVLRGENTRPVFRVVFEGLRDRIPCAEWQIISQATHLLNWDNPAAFNHAVIDFLQRHNADA